MLELVLQVRLNKYFIDDKDLITFISLGFPSVGKSTLLSNLAGVYSEVAAYEFTTLTTVPGCIKYKGAKIQVINNFNFYFYCRINYYLFYNKIYYLLLNIM